MTMMLLSLPVTVCPKHQNQAQRQAERDDDHHILEHQTSAFRQRHGRIQRVQSFQLSQQAETLRHQGKSFRAGSAVSSSGPASILTFKRCIRKRRACRVIFNWSAVFARMKWYCSSRLRIKSLSKLNKASSSEPPAIADDSSPLRKRVS